MTKRGLGKGLSSLIPEDTVNTIQQAYIPNLPITRIVPNSYQPRVDMDPEKLMELAESIKEHGIIEPLIVNQNSVDEYELIAGERRWRAAKLAGIKTVPVVVKDASPQNMLELAIIENIQREDLNPLEEAMAFEQLVKKFELTHTEIAKKVGYSRPAIANKIRLLQLPEEIKKGLIEGKLSEGHARALLGIENSETMKVAYHMVIKDGLSVRATEALVQRLRKTKDEPKRTTQQKVELNSKLLRIERQLQNDLKTKVKISVKANGGKITIPFENEMALDKILKKLL